VLLHVLTQKGRGFQPALDGQKEVSRPRAPTILKPARPSPPASHLRRGLRQHAGPAGRQGRAHRGHHRRHAQRHRPRSLPAASSQALLRRGHRRGARGGLCRRHGHARLPAGLRHLLHLPAARLRSHRARRRLQKLPVLFCMDRAGSPATTAPRITASSTSPTCAAFRRWC
jgi:hypothetical protein